MIYRATPKRLGDGAQPKVGTYVYDKADERHIGRLEFSGEHGCKVRWLETGWFSEGVPHADLYTAPLQAFQNWRFSPR